MSRRHRNQAPQDRPTIPEGPKLPEGRAFTPEEKRALVERVLRAWLASPHLRIGQFISNAMFVRGNPVGGLAYVEDDTFATVLELYASAPHDMAPKGVVE